MLILNDNKILEFLDSENKNIPPTFKTEQIQVHLDFMCGCKITQDRKGNWWHPCPSHGMKAWEFRKEGFIHKHL